ncbi:hypothetical protein, partial [Staphylococcus aureus]
GGMPGQAQRWRLHGPQGEVAEIDYVAAMVTDDMHLAMQAAIGGAGVALLPFNVCHAAIEGGQLRVLLPQHRGTPHQLH